ncbi:dienelactone hydrolase family protein [Pandoraea fibrosis]|uniref:Carboxymethylenebutenolidase n=1 Tax=Pandoraea fibrosis TaxID=1891094 RepID=A0A5E4WWL9_9BURK|nr:dienelactone hydrolase family protein [Pandoraea fibrosis]QHE93153.1 carboxymethylenebutenolidase [Pandoraea fibrosis]QHF13288.1 carboxymethylenebutenolidase [Pandoraea fibrosis]VVE29227.1 carboxymethylenebutenolidase [Pandoraea fibrosis]
MSQADLDSLVPEVAPRNRRDFLKTAVGSAFALAVLPVAAETITTDTQGLEAGEVMLDVPGIKMPVYYAKPAGKTHLPTVIVVSEIFGVHQHIADICRRFAKLGYLALAPELFARAGDPQSLGTIAEIQSQIVSKTPDKQVLSDIDATLKWAVANGGDEKRLGITGFCWGGRVAWLYDAHNPNVKAAVAWYGRIVGDKSANFPQNPIDIAGKLHGPLLGLYGGKDTGIPVASVEQAREALAKGNAASKGSELKVFPNSGHAFFADYRASYVEADAKEGWTLALDWFRKHGVA